MKISWRTELPIWILLAAMLVAAAMAWPTAPDRIPTHWGLDGEVNGYGGKFEGLLLIPLVALVAYGSMILLPRLDPRRFNYEKFAGAYTTLRLALVALFAAIQGIILAAVNGKQVDIQRTAPLLVGIFLVVVGGVLRRVQPNWFVGVRTPWTLSSKTSWDKTHGVASWVFIAGGILLAIAGLVGYPAGIIAAFAVLLVGVLGTVAYSYFAWRDAPDRSP